MTFLVTIDGAAGGVKNLKHHTASLLRLYSQVLHSFLQLTQEEPMIRKPLLETAVQLLEGF